MMKNMFKSSKKKLLLALLLLFLLTGVVVGFVILRKQIRVWAEPVLNSLDYDAANVADDEWTARY